MGVGCALSWWDKNGRCGGAGAGAGADGGVGVGGSSRLAGGDGDVGE